MISLPKLLVSSVVRGANQGDSHGGLYLVDLETGDFDQKLDWDTCDIDFAGRGADRGLRGIAVCDDVIYVAASDELFAFDRDFNIIGSYRNAYLKHCHEIWLHRGALFLTSTGFDSILRFDLSTRSFDFGVQLQGRGGAPSARTFDPAAPGGPAPGVNFHLNSVFVDDSGIYLCGLRLPALMRITPKSISIAAPVPLGTHNARPFGAGVIFNDTGNDRLTFMAQGVRVEIGVPQYDEKDLLRADADTSGVARQAFARGLCPLSDNLIAGGSSPTTVAVYDLSARRCAKAVNLTMDMRNAAHGMAVWPY